MAFDLKNIKNTAKEKFRNALFGVPTQTREVAQSMGYGEDIDNYLNTLGEKEYMQGLLNQPKEVGLTLDQYKRGVAQGLNYGIPEIAETQKQLGIRIPVTEEEKYNAQLGDFNQPTVVNMGVANAPRKGGFINDIVRGYEENLNNKFNTSNLDFDENKSLATRIGEGFGTATRFINSPVGRGLAVAGATMALGGGAPLASLLGAKSAVGRQKAITGDKIYRSQLKQLGMSDEELNDIKGNITKDIFEGVTSGMRLGNQRMTYGQLAQFDENVAEMVAKNPELANQFVPVNFGRDVYSKKRDRAEGKMAETYAKTKKIEAETKQVGKPRVNISIRQGGTNSKVTHVGQPNSRPAQKDYVQNDYVQMQAPNGKIYKVPKADIQKYINAGGKVIG